MKKIVVFLLACMLLMGSVAFARVELPEGYPEVRVDPKTGKPYDLEGQTVYIMDYWSGDGSRVHEPTEEQQAQYDYRDWLEETYNCTIVQKQGGDWNTCAEEMINFTSAPDGSLRVYIIEPGKAASLATNGIAADWSNSDAVDLTDDHWNSTVVDGMTIGSGVYGVSTGMAEPKGCVYFNKRLLEEAGIDWETLYDMQAEGTWTWDAWEEVLQKTTKDTDNDGVIDTYGVSGSGDDMYVLATFANGGSFFALDEDGMLEPNMASWETLEALNWGQDIQSKYWKHTPAGANWDWYKQAWENGEFAFYVYQTYGGYNDNSEMADMEDEWGCLAFPVPNEGDKYVSIISENTTMIPNVYSDDELAKISLIYELWTQPTPGYDNPDAWIGNKYNYTDDRAVDETYAMLREAEHQAYNIVNLLGTQNDILGTSLLWSLSGSELGALIESGMPAWEALCDSFNENVMGNVTVKKELKITQQPISVIVASGEKARVQVVAKGDGLKYQWYVKAKGTSSFTKSSITSAAYSVNMNSARNGNQVYCVVTDKNGNSVQSNTVTLSMKPPLSITTQPASVSVASGEKASVKVGAQGDGLKYQWFVKAKGTSTFKKSSITGATYSVNMTSARNGNQVYCVVTDKNGNSVQSYTVTLSMTLSITTQPASVSVASGEKARVKVVAQGEGLQYRWYVKAKGTSTFTKSSITGATYSVTMTSDRNGNQVYCVVMDKNGDTVQSNTVTLSMKTPLSITTQPASVRVASGEKASVKVVAQGDGLKYQWYVKAKGTSSFTKSSTTSATYSVHMTSARNGNQVYCVVTDENGNSVQSNTVTLSMKTPLSITTQPASVRVASGEKARVKVVAQGDGLKYQWYVKAKGTSTFTKSSTTSATYSVHMTSARNGNQVYCVVTDENGNTVQSNTVTLSMKTPLSITTQPASVSVASGEKARVKVVAQGDGLKYQWFVKAKGTSTFTKSSITSATYSVTMTSARNGNQVYCVVTDENGNTVQSNTVTISMK